MSIATCILVEIITKIYTPPPTTLIYHHIRDEQDAVRKVSKISAAHLHSAALLDFDLYMWGCGTSGQLGIPDKLYVHAPTKVATEGPVHTVACSDRFTCYMLRSGAVVTMGSVCPARELDGEIDINGEPILLESAWKVKKIFQLPNFDSQTFLGSNACLAVGNSHIIFTSGAYESKSQSLLSRFNSLSSRESGYYTLECRLMRRLMGNTPATSSQGAIAGPRRRRSISGDESTNIVHTEEDMLTIEDIRLILFHKDCRLNDLMTEMCRAYKKRVIFRSVHAQGNLTQRIHKLIGDRMCLSSDSIIREEIMPVPRRTLQTSLILRVSVAGSIAENVANEAQNLTQNTRDREEMVQLVKLSSENKRFQGHDRPITCITSDDVYLFTASEDGIIRGWRKKMSNFTFAHPCEKVFEGHSDQVTGIVVVQVDVQEAEGFPGRLLCSASCDNTLRIWDVQLEETIDVVEHQSRVLQIVYSDLGILYTGCEDGSVYVYDFRNPRSRRVLSHTSPSAISAMTCDDNFLYCGRVDGNLVAYQTSNIRNPQLSTSAEVFVKEDRHDDRAHQAAVSCLFESTDYLFSGGHDNCVNIWKKGSRQLVKVVGGSFQHERLVTSITYVPDKCMLITSSWDGTVRLRSLEFLGNSVRINSLTHVIRDHLSTSDFDTFRPLGFAKYVGGWLLVSSDEPMSKELQQATQASKMSVYKTIAFDLRGWSPKDDNPVNNLLRYRMAGHQDMITCVHIDNNDVYTGGKDGNAIRFQADLNSEYIQPRTVRQDQLYSSFIRRVKFQHLPWILNYLSVVMILFDLFNMLGLPLRRKDSIESKSQFFRAILQSFEIDFENGNLRTSFFIILAFGLVTSLLVVDKLTFQATRYEYAVKIRNYTFILSAVATIYANVVGGIVYFSIIGKLYPDSLPKAKLGSIIDELSPGTIPRLLLFLLVILFALCCLRLHVLNCSIDRVNYLDLDRRLRSFGREMDWKHRIKTFFTHSDDLPEIRNHFLFSKQDYTWDKLYVLVKMCFIVVTSYAVEVKIIAPILLAFVSFMFVLLFKRPPFYSIYAMTVRAVVLVDLCVSYIFLIFNNEDYTYGRYDIMPLFVILIGVSFVSTFIILRYLNAKQTKTLVVDQPDHRQQSLILIQETFPVAPQPPRMSFSTQMLLPRQFSIRSNH
eukprot:TRINITY_DN6464_c0_g1_i1.p1 TRINITY_DN6464_c0_g1~~TRINITY_DN6464_c0_g1_i1.p1  ORF type:complete len:1160 (+),score=165.91 TRINITY_DN6464_c0_g1_i1:1084-4563(+)